MKKVLSILVIVFLCGVVIADICMKQLNNGDVGQELELFQNYAYSKVTFREIIWPMFYERGKIVLALILVYLTPLRDKIPILCMGIFSFCIGFFCMSCVLVLGIVGVFVAFGAIFPHGLFYGAIVLLMFRTKQSRYYRTGEGILDGAMRYVLAVLLFVSGCVVESMMGVHFIPWIIRLSRI